MHRKILDVFDYILHKVQLDLMLLLFHLLQNLVIVIDVYEFDDPLVKEEHNEVQNEIVLLIKDPKIFKVKSSFIYKNQILQVQFVLHMLNLLVQHFQLMNVGDHSNHHNIHNNKEIHPKIFHKIIDFFFLKIIISQTLVTSSSYCSCLINI